MGKTKLFFIFLILFFCMCGTASAALTYTANDGISFASTDNIHNLPQLYSALQTKYGAATTDSTIMTQVSPGVWWVSHGIFTSDANTQFYINSSTCTELRIGTDSSGESLGYYFTINNTKLVCYISGAPAGFGNCGTIELRHPIHDTVLNNFKEIDFEDVANTRIYNLSLSYTYYGIEIQDYDNITMDNITVRDGNPETGGGIHLDTNRSTISNITAINVSDPDLESTFCYGMLIAGADNIIRDCNLDGTGYSAFDLCNDGDYISNNNTIDNITINKSGHNGFEQEGNNSRITNLSVSNSVSNNIFQVGKQNYQKRSINNVYENIYSYNPGGSGFRLSDGSDNITITNLTIVGNGIEIDCASNSTFINCTQDGIAPVRGEAQVGYRPTARGGYFFSFDRDHTVIDSSFTNNNYFGINEVICKNLQLINVFGSYNIDTNYENDCIKYYYPNITIKNTQGNPVQNAVITVNTSAVNGLGKSQSTFYTDSNGKLYSSGNRSNWLAIPDQKLQTTESGLVTTSYITNITATKDGKSNSTVVNPDNTWFSSNPASLSSPAITLTLDVSAILPVADFSTDVSSGYFPLAVQFTDLSQNTTSWAWNFGDGNTSTAQNPTHTYYTAGNYTVNLTASNANGTDSKSATINVTQAPVYDGNLSSNTSLSLAGPYIGSLVYDSPTTGTPNQYGINGGKQSRIRQNGYIRGAQFALANVNNLERFNVCIWRKNDDTGIHTLVGKTENLKPNITQDGVQNINFSTPIYAKEGDYIGWECDGIAASPVFITTSSVPASTTDAIICHGTGKTFAVGDQFNFVNSAMYITSNKIFRINVFMDAVDTAFIGDSEVSGRVAHTSFIDPGSDYNPWSSMSYWWGVYSGRTYQNLGWRGQTTTQIKNRFDADAIALHPSNVFIEGGLNDFTASITKETTLSNLCWMANETVANGAHAYLCEIPPSTGYGDSGDWEDWQWVNDQLKIIYANSSDVTVIPIRDYVGTNYASGPEGNLWSIKSEYDGGDALHYNIAGFQRWGAVIYNYYSNQFTADVRSGSPPIQAHFSIFYPTISDSTLPTLAGWSRSAEIETATTNSSNEYIYIPKYPDMKSDSSDVRFFLSDGTILSSQYISNLSDTYFVYNFTHPADTSVYCAWGNASTPALEYTESGDLDYHENGESTTNWTVETSTIESSTTKVHSGTHSLKYTDLTANSFDDECTYMLPSETSEITLEYWASPSQTNTYSRMCPFDGAASDRKGPWVAFANDGAIEYYTGSGWNSDGTPYNTTNWYKIKLVCSGSTYDFYINDTLVHSNIATYNPVTAYDRIVIFGYTASGTSCYFDDINISYPSISLPSLQSTFRMPATSIQNSYSWDLDNDGDVDSTSLTPSFTYSSYGLYTVNLTVANDAFDISNVKTNYISLVNENRITPTITWSNPSSIPYGTALSSTQLNAQASVPGSFVYNPSSGTVLNAGTHALNCTFTPTDITNYTTATKSVSITVNTVTPVANFSSNTTGGDNPLSVQFTDLSRNSPTGWSWTFGDSQTSTSQNPVHTYSSAGAYNVTLTASNTAGNDSETKVNYITVTQRAPQSAAEWFWYLMSFVRW